MSFLNQAITITGPRSVDLDRLEAIGDMFKAELIREGGDPNVVSVQRSPDEMPESIKIDVFIESDFSSPDGGFNFHNYREFTVHGDNPHVALYRRSAAIGEIQNHVMRAIAGMTQRLVLGSAPGGYVPLNWDLTGYIAETVDAAISTLPNMAAGR